MAGAQALGFRCGQTREGSGPSGIEAAGTEIGPTQTPTSPVTQQDIMNTPMNDGHLSFFNPSPHFTDGLTEAQRGPCTKSLGSKEEGQGWKPGSRALVSPAGLLPTPCLAHSGLMVRTGWVSVRGGSVGLAP